MDRLLFDVTGQLQWYGNLRHASGIQRITEHILGSRVIRQSAGVEFIARPIGGADFFNIDKDQILALCDSRNRHNAIGRLRGTIATIMRCAPLFEYWREARYFDLPYYVGGKLRLERAIANWSGAERHASIPKVTKIAPPTAADSLINTGDFWCHRRYVESIVNLKRATGVKIILVVHDLFYIDNPEWNHPAFTDFAEQLSRLAPHVSVWMPTSRFVEAQLRSYLQGRGISDPRVKVLPMGWGGLSRRRSLEPEMVKETLSKYGLEKQRYFISVGKIEPRRNFTTLLKAFSNVRQRVHDVPTCVLVGQDGWKSTAFKTQLRSSNFEDGAVRWLRDVSDEDLSALYSAALFCVVPSLAEGWGLPIREAISHGLPCLASSIGGSVEAGGDLATYFDPRNVHELSVGLTRWISSPERLAEARLRVNEGIHGLLPYDWESTAEAIAEAARQDA